MDILNLNAARREAYSNAVKAFVQENYRTLSELARRCYDELGPGYIDVPNYVEEVEYRTLGKAHHEDVFEAIRECDPDTEAVLKWTPSVEVEKDIRRKMAEDGTRLTDPGDEPKTLVYTFTLHPDYRE